MHLGITNLWGFPHMSKLHTRLGIQFDTISMLGQIFAQDLWIGKKWRSLYYWSFKSWFHDEEHVICKTCMNNASWNNVIIAFWQIVSYWSWWQKLVIIATSVHVQLLQEDHYTMINAQSYYNQLSSWICFAWIQK